MSKQSSSYLGYKHSQGLITNASFAQTICDLDNQLPNSVTWTTHREALHSDAVCDLRERRSTVDQEKSRSNRLRFSIKKSTSVKCGITPSVVAWISIPHEHAIWQESYSSLARTPVSYAARSSRMKGVTPRKMFLLYCWSSLTAKTIAT